MYIQKLITLGALTSANEQPNSHVALFDFALPGTQPIFQKGTVLPAIRAALALGCRIERRSQFDRKHYFYADQPAGYQITQYYHPFANGGKIVLNDFDGIAQENGKSTEIEVSALFVENQASEISTGFRWRETCHIPQDFQSIKIPAC